MNTNEIIAVINVDTNKVTIGNEVIALDDLSNFLAKFKISSNGKTDIKPGTLVYWACDDDHRDNYPRYHYDDFINRIENGNFSDAVRWTYLGNFDDRFVLRCTLSLAETNGSYAPIVLADYIIPEDAVVNR